jgi:glycosyltransferase involved in cell wall biosynthesis
VDSVDAKAMDSDHVADKLPASLAIIIPACRIRYFGDALRSIAAQTDRRFSVYVGDDCSPEPLEAVVETFRSQIDIHYKRFEPNLGSTDLIAHWHRCITLSEKEPWLWLFSDDDVMEPECVARFYDAIELRTSPRVDLFRFQLDHINEHSARSVRWSAHPSYEKSDDLLRALLSDQERAFRAQEHIFSRRIYENNGGFVNFPKAIYSDHATWLCFSANSGVCTVSGPRVMWRSHPFGTTSGMKSAHRLQWHEAARLYIQWLSAFSKRQGPEAVRIFQRSGRGFYFREISQFRPVLTRAERQAATNFAQRIFGGSWISAYFHLHYSLVRQKVIFQRLIEPYREWKIRQPSVLLWLLSKGRQKRSV